MRLSNKSITVGEKPSPEDKAIELLLLLAMAVVQVGCLGPRLVPRVKGTWSSSWHQRKDSCVIRRSLWSRISRIDADTGVSLEGIRGRAAVMRKEGSLLWKDRVCSFTHYQQQAKNILVIIVSATTAFGSELTVYRLTTNNTDNNLITVNVILVANAAFRTLQFPICINCSKARAHQFRAN